jgi:hypothetical protein
MFALRLRRLMTAVAADADPVGRLLLSGWIARRSAPTSRLAAWGVAWAETCADYHRAACLYEELRHRSDTALRSRRLNRIRLAWEIAQICDRTNGTP